MEQKTTDTTEAQQRQALATHLRGMADAIADGTLPIDEYTAARMQFDLYVHDFASRDEALAAIEALAVRLGAEVMHSGDRHQVTRTWVDPQHRWLEVEYKAILWEDDDAVGKEAAAEAAADPIEESQDEALEPEQDRADAETERRLARVSSAVGGLVRLRKGGYLKNVRAGEHIDAITAALDGHSSPSALVQVDDDTVYVSDGVVTSTFSVSEAYTVLHALVNGLPDARRVLGIETVGAA